MVTVGLLPTRLIPASVRYVLLDWGRICALNVGVEKIGKNCFVCFPSFIGVTVSRRAACKSRDEEPVDRYPSTKDCRELPRLEGADDDYCCRW